MNRKNSEDEVPSIIQEIVFYDKPNIKTVVPEEILPESTVFPLGKGDLVFSCIRKSSLSQSSAQEDVTNLPEISNDKSKSPKQNSLKNVKTSQNDHHQVNSPETLTQKSETPNESRLKNVEKTSTLDEVDNLGNRPLESLKKELKENLPDSSIDSLNHFIDYENLGDDPLEPVVIPCESSKSNKGSIDTLGRGKEPQESSQGCITVEIVNTKKGISQLDKTPILQLPKKRSRASLSDEQTKRRTDHNKESSKEKKTLTEKLRPKRNKEASNTGKKSVEVMKGATSPFKKPKRPAAKKAEVKSQKFTMLNYLTIKSKKGGEQKREDKKLISTKETSSKSIIQVAVTKEATVEEFPTEKKPRRAVRKCQEAAKIPENTKVSNNDAPKNSVGQKRSKGRPKKNVELKRPRGRPRKMSAGESDTVSESYYSDDDVSFRSSEKTKNVLQYAELTNVPLDNAEASVDSTIINTDNLEELLDEANEQVRALGRVEEELQTMFKTRQRQGRKQITKGKRNTPSRKSKPPVMLVKRVKKEMDEDSVDESSVDPLDVSNVEDYGSDEDSRGEWVPLEYAEYRQQHIMKQLNKMFPCKFCGNQFSSYYGMRKHRALEHGDVGKDRKEGTYKEPVQCKQEKDQVESDEESREEWMPQDYADYKMKHKMNKMRVQWYKCKICCAVFSNYYKLSKHRVEHENKPDPYECKQCDARFKDVETLMAHIRVHQGKDPYQCKKCDKGFMTKAELDEHVPVHVLKKGPTAPKRFRCDICGKEFSKLCDIERHTRVHTGEKPCECNICHKRFQQSHNLSKHLLTHLHVKPFQCDICNKKFGRVDVLNRHLLTHSMEKPFNCEICSKGFIRQVQLTNHIEKFHTSSDRGLITGNDQPGEDEASIDNEEFEEDEYSEEVTAV